MNSAHASAHTAESSIWLQSSALEAALANRWRLILPFRTPLRAKEFPATVLIPTYEAVADVLRDKMYGRDPRQTVEENLYFADLGRSYGGVADGGSPAPMKQMLFLDGAAHERARRPITAAIGQGQRQFPAMISKIVGDVLHELDDRRAFDIVDDFASKVSLRAISSIIGIAPADETHIRKLAEDVFGFFISASSPDSVERGSRAFDALVAIMVSHVDELRGASADEKGIFFRVLRDINEQSMSADEWGVQLAGLFVAGSLTTADLIASSSLALLAFPGIRRSILSDDTLVHGLIEEILRLEPPSTFSYRVAKEPGSILECPYERGEILYASINNANRDALVFERPDEIELTRKTPHLTFGGGAHFCPGAPLARIEAAIAVQSLFERYPNLAYASANPPEWSPSPHRCALLELPVAEGPHA